MNIDWIKAPEDATHYAEVDSSRVCWYMVKSESEYAYAYQDEGFSCERWTEICGSPGHKPLIERPKKQDVWGGVGLPPIGMASCEYLGAHKYDEWTVVNIFAHYGHTVFVDFGDGWRAEKDSSRFRPIKTAEQLEEEEREKEAIELYLTMQPASNSKAWDNIGDYARDRYRLAISSGYRKK